MPVWKVTTPDGRAWRWESDHEPTDSELASTFGAQSEQPESERTSAVAAAGRAAGENVLPTLASLPGAAIGAETGGAIGLLGGPFAPVTVPVGAGIGAAIGGIGTFLLGKEAQDEAIDEFAPQFGERLRQLEAGDAAQHPIARFAGGVAGSLPAFTFAPGQSIREAAALLRGGEGAREAAISLGSKIGGGAGVGAGAPLLEGRTPTWSDVAQGAAFPLFLGKPRFSFAAPATEESPPLEPEVIEPEVIPEQRRLVAPRRFFAPENGPAQDAQARPVRGLLPGPRGRFVTTPDGYVVDVDALSPEELFAFQQTAAFRGRPPQPETPSEVIDAEVVGEEPKAAPPEAAPTMQTLQAGLAAEVKALNEANRHLPLAQRISNQRRIDQIQQDLEDWPLIEDFEAKLPAVPGNAALPAVPTGEIARAATDKNRPAVPETLPEPQKPFHALAEIRAQNARTIAEIQKLFPQARLNREAARVLRNLAWGEPALAAPKLPPSEPPAEGGIPVKVTPPAPPAAPAARTILGLSVDEFTPENLAAWKEQNPANYKAVVQRVNSRLGKAYNPEKITPRTLAEKLADEKTWDAAGESAPAVAPAAAPAESVDVPVQEQRNSPPIEPTEITAAEKPQSPQTETPIAAAAKVGDHIEGIKAQAERLKARNEDAAAKKRSDKAKRIKNELVERLQQSVDQAPPKEVFDAAQKPKKMPSSEWDKSRQITIEIPDDGTFTVQNHQEALGEVLLRAKKLSTATESKNFKESKPAAGIPADVWVESSEPTHTLTIEGANGESKKPGRPIEVKAYPGKPFFLTSNGKDFTITEPRTGRSIGNGDTINAALRDAENHSERLKEKGITDDFNTLLEKNLKEYGERPKPEPIQPNPPSNIGEHPGGPGAAFGQKFADEGPSPAALGLNAGNPILNRLKARAQNIAEGFRQLFARTGVKRDLPMLANAADGLAQDAGRRAGNSIRLRVKTDMDDRAATFIMQAIGRSADQGVTPEQYLQTAQADMETAAQSFLKQKKNLNAQAAIDAAKAYQHARNNFNRLKTAAQAGHDQLDAQVARENGNGLNVAYEDWYVPQRYDADFLPRAKGPVILGNTGGGIAGAQFKKAKVFADYAEAIENGYIPKDLKLSDLVDHRVSRGERLLQRRVFFDGMREIKDPVDGNPLVATIERKPIKRADGTTDFQEVIPAGYKRFEILPGQPIAVHEGYARLVNALTATSQLSESAAFGALQNLAAFEKHVALALDTFHASRTMQAELALTGKVSVGARQKLGLALLEYHPQDLALAVKNGLITPEMAAWVTTPKPFKVGGQTVNLSPRDVLQVGLKNGVNIGRFADALRKDWMREIPGTGTVNKWVFDKLTRSAMAHGFISEFERVAANNPKMDANTVAKTVSRDINVLFGNLQKESFFKNPSLRAINQVLFLAPQWVESIARREGRALLQTGKIPLDLARGQKPQVGTVAKTVGTGLAAYFVATQVLNLITRGKLTFDNQEKGHKLDAWIPDASGKSPGFFISPLSVFAEITHDILRYSHEKPSVAEAVSQIGQNKLGNLGRFLEVVVSGHDPLTGEKLVSSADRALSAGKQLVPVPIAAQQVARAAEAAAGAGQPPRPGDVQRQLTASLGFKTEKAPTPEQQVRELAADWMSTAADPKIRHRYEQNLQATYAPSEYQPLRNALKSADTTRAAAEYQNLLTNRGGTGTARKEIAQTMREWQTAPLTGSKMGDAQFLKTLSPEQKALYQSARQNRKQIWQQFLKLPKTKG